MQKFCTNCGAQLPESCYTCPNCGTMTNVELAGERTTNPQQSYSSPVRVTEPPKARNFHWWMVAIPVVLAIALVSVLCWQPLLMAVAPKAALAMAMENTSNSLAKRYKDSPVAVLEKGAACMQNGQIALNADADYEGEEYEVSLTMGFQQEKKQMTFSAAAEVMGRSYATDAYLDSEFAAVSVDFFNDGTFYGVTFETFKEDAMKSVLAEYMSEDDIDQIDNMIQSMLKLYNSDVDTAELLEPYEVVIREYVLELETEKGSGNVKLDGETYSCTTLTYVLEEDDIVELYEQLLEVMKEDEQLKAYICQDSFVMMTGEDMEDRWNEVIDTMEEAIKELRKEVEFDANLIFFVRNGRLVNIRIDAEIDVDGEVLDLRFDLNYGLKYDSDLVCKLVMECDGEKVVVKVTSAVTNNADKFQETISLAVDTPYASTSEVELTTKWNKESGKLTMKAIASYDGEQMESISLVCKLNELDNGFQISFDEDDIAEFMEQMDAGLPDGLHFSVTIACTEGAEIQKPDYVNLDQWDEALLQQLQDAIYENFYADAA